EALALPTEESAVLALRTQQIIASETGVIDTADPFGGSYYLENLTAEMEAGMEALIKKIEDEGGVVSCIERGLIQNWIAESAYKQQKAIDSGERTVVGVNKYRDEADSSPEIFSVPPELAGQQIEQLGKVKQDRDRARVEAALARLQEAARGDENLMDATIEAVEAYATLGEITDILKDEFGEFREPISL
ncbi:MAG: methylmalonyl-CoA mutase, partial [Nitrospinaceae bacterium]|nr:methylmalonyl-CoA mutase [Nitrospinaceae bacterium]